MDIIFPQKPQPVSKKLKDIPPGTVFTGYYISGPTRLWIRLSTLIAAGGKGGVAEIGGLACLIDSDTIINNYEEVKSLTIQV